MTIRLRLLHTLVAAVTVACVGLPGAGAALANGVGDLYVATAGGVDEVFLAGGDVVETVPVTPAPTRLAFTPDGRSLYAADGARSLVRIDIESISVAQTYALPSATAAIAHPRGDALLLAYPGSKSLGVLIDGNDAPEPGVDLPGAVDILAADRRETRIIATQAGGSWAAIVEPASAEVRKVVILGKVVAAVIARDEGFAYVVTTEPNRLVRVALATGAIDWTVDLAGVPVDVTAIPSAAIVAIGRRLFQVEKGTVSAWAEAPAAVLHMIASDEGRFVYAAMTDAVVALSVADPGAKPSATVAIAEGVPEALAPVPRNSSLVNIGGAGTTTGSGNDGTGTQASAGPSHAPATDTEDGGPLFRRAGQDPLTLFGTAAAIALVVALATRYVLRRVTRDR